MKQINVSGKALSEWPFQLGMIRPRLFETFCGLNIWEDAEFLSFQAVMTRWKRLVTLDKASTLATLFCVEQ